MDSRTEWLRRCEHPGCRCSVFYPGPRCPSCGTLTVPLELPEPCYPLVIARPHLPPHQAPALDAPPMVRVERQKRRRR